MLEIDRGILGYMIRELQWDKLMEKADSRIWQYKKRLVRRNRNELARIYWEIVKNKARERKGKF